MIRISSNVLLFFLLFPIPSFASQEYGESCNAQLPCTAGLICVEKRCIHTCNLRNPICPNHEKCLATPNGLTACYCKTNKDCTKSSMLCVRGLCVGTQSIGQLCDDTSKFCDGGLICTKLQNAQSARCYQLCSGTTCITGEPCHKISTFSACYCLTNADCHDGTCKEGQCIPNAQLGQSCDQNNPCSDDFACTKISPKKSVCLITCPSNRCLGGEKCVSQSGKRVCMCSIKNPCPNGVSCINGFCQIGVRCDPKRSCSSKDEICFSPLAGLNQGVCIKTCKNTNPSTCPSKTPCQILSSGKYACFCKTKSDCNGKKCINYQCATKCMDNSDCHLGEHCDSKGKCVKGLPFERPLPDFSFEMVVPDIISIEEKSTQEKTAELTNERINEKKKEAKPKPPCSPPCQAPLQCIEGKCSKAALGSDCQSNAECTSGLCFGPNVLKVCSTTNCSQCGSNMSCQSFNGTTACYLGRITPKTDNDTPKACACQSNSMDASWLIFFFVFLLIFIPKSKKA